MKLYTIFTTGLLTCTVHGALSKPALHQDLEYCKKGLLDNLRSPGWQKYAWSSGYIFESCRQAAVDNSLDPRDMRVWSINYNDCFKSPWAICVHINAPNSIDSAADYFGRLPVGARGYVRHLITLPITGGAYTVNNDIVMKLDLTNQMTVFAHETGHCMDFGGGYSPDKPLSSSQAWNNAYNADSAVPDPYAQTNQVENVAQNNVLALYDFAVPGGFGAIEPNWRRCYTQYGLVKQESDAAGNLLRPGGTCNKRLNFSPTVFVGTRKRGLVPKAGTVENPKLAADIEVIPSAIFDTRLFHNTTSHPAE